MCAYSTVESYSYTPLLLCILLHTYRVHVLLTVLRDSKQQGHGHGPDADTDTSEAELVRSDLIFAFPPSDRFGANPLH